MKQQSLIHSLTIVLVLVLLTSGCTRKEGSETKAPKSLLSKTDNIVLVVFDTTRTDRLPFYNDKVDTAPFLSSLAKESVVFENAFAGCSSTAPAMASIFTALYPSQHGVITGKQATKRLQKQNPTVTLNRIPSSLTTLGQLLSENGYPGYGASDNLNISEEMGYLKGFTEFDTFHYEGAPKVNETILSYQEKVKDHYFMYVHYMDPHAPYKKQAPWFDETRKDKQLAAYDSEIRYTDEHLKKLFEKYGWKDNALVIFLSDHGEEFGDHGGMGHGKTLYPEVIHVPFFIYHRDLPARRVQDTVHTADLMPTLAKILGKPLEDRWEGQELTPYLAPSPPKSPKIRYVYSELLRLPDHPRGSQRAVVEESWLYIKKFGEKLKKVREQLFDLQFDPLANTDVSKVETDTLTHMQDGLKDLDSRTLGVAKENIEVQMDDETIEHLKTLGYVN